jgi:hypothetical protein
LPILAARIENRHGRLAALLEGAARMPTACH